MRKGLVRSPSSFAGVHSYVVADKTYCIYLAPSMIDKIYIGTVSHDVSSGEEAIKKHAEVSGFPATQIEEVRAIIDPISGYGAGIAR